MLEAEPVNLLWARRSRLLTFATSKSQRLPGIDRPLKAMERGQMLFGLDAPMRVDTRIIDARDARMRR